MERLHLAGGDDGGPLSEFRGNVEAIRDLYASMLPIKSAEEAREKYGLPNSLTELGAGETLLPEDWMFLPLLQVYDRDQVAWENQ